MREDAVSKLHPAVIFVYFFFAVLFAALVQHPVYLGAALSASALYCILLNGKKGVKTVLRLLPVFAFITLINPLFNTRGRTVLFTVFKRPYTLEALFFGLSIASVFTVMVLWFGAFSAVMTGEKFVCLVGRAAPSVSMLLVSVHRLVPSLVKRARQISDARDCVGKGGASASGLKEKVRLGSAALGSLASWSLEGGVAAADSMRSRGYGTGKRTSFTVFRITKRDAVILIAVVLLAGAVVADIASGGTRVNFVPDYDAAPLSGVHAAGFAAYCIYLFFPSALHISEEISWSISRYRI